jgi:hypothetical protein
MNKIIVYTTEEIGPELGGRQFYGGPATDSTYFNCVYQQKQALVFTDKCYLDTVLTNTDWVREFRRSVEDVE